jgi:pimeloyl-ACP methyl ester carboxylesterase
LHGTADGAFVWDRFANEIGGRWRVLAIDLPGHGNSSWLPRADYDLASFTAALVAVAEALDLRKAVLIGHSLGSDIAVNFASSFPERVQGLVIVDGGPDSGRSEAREVVREQMLESCRPYATVQAYVEWMREHKVFADPELMADYASHAVKVRLDGFVEPKFDPAVAEILKEAGDDSEWWKRALATIKAPTLIVRGLASSVLSIGSAKDMVRWLSNGRLAVVERAGHAVMADNPGAFAAVVIRFLDQLLRLEP